MQTEALPELGPLENLPGLQRELETLAKRYAQLPDRAPLLEPWHDGALRIEKLVGSVQSRLPAALVGEHKVRNFASKVYVSTSAVWNVYGRPMTVSAGGGAAGASAAAGGSGQVSASVSHAGGGAVGGGGGDLDVGAASDAHHDADEPISDDDTI